MPNNHEAVRYVRVYTCFYVIYIRLLVTLTQDSSVSVVAGLRVG
jgi:hypothetical protein